MNMAASRTRKRPESATVIDTPERVLELMGRIGAPVELSDIKYQVPTAAGGTLEWLVRERQAHYHKGWGGKGKRRYMVGAGRCRPDDKVARAILQATCLG